MGTYVTDAAGSGFFRLRTPTGLLVVGQLQRFCQPLLQIFHLNEADLAQLPRQYPATCLTHQRVGAVVMGQDQLSAALAHRLCQLQSLGIRGA
ncbi:hypothetical protein D3C76_1406630 [compost metagenome]